MEKQVSASDAKNNFGGLLDSVAAVGRVDIMRHGRLVAVVLSPSRMHAIAGALRTPGPEQPRNKHMIPAHLARQALVLSEPVELDED